RPRPCSSRVATRRSTIELPDEALAGAARGERTMTAMTWLRAIALVIALAIPASPQTLVRAELLASLRAGGYVIYFRHADTDHSRQDQRPMNFDDCTTQRVLSDKGRQNSRAIGEAIRGLDVPIGSVLASPLCRTVETAVLAFGTAEKSMATREGGPEPV